VSPNDVSAAKPSVYDGFVSIQLGRPTDRKPPYKFSALTRVGFSDTDAQGIVYYGRYLPYFDHARVEYHRHLGLLGLDLGSAEFVIRAASVLYEAPARFDDLIEVFVRTKRIGRTSVTDEYCAYRVEDDVLMCTAEQTLVLVDLAERRPTPVPESYRRVVVDFEGADIELAVAS
jgi:acyl-CoA thioester hydrolase